MIVVIIGASLFFIGMALVLVSGRGGQREGIMRVPSSDIRLEKKTYANMETAPVVNKKVEEIIGQHKSICERLEKHSADFANQREKDELLAKEINSFKAELEEHKRSSKDAEAALRNELIGFSQENQALGKKYGQLDFLRSQIDEIKASLADGRQKVEHIKETAKKGIEELEKTLAERIKERLDREEIFRREIAAIAGEGAKAKAVHPESESIKGEIIDLKAAITEASESGRDNFTKLKDELTRLSLEIARIDKEGRAVEGKPEAIKAIRGEIVDIRAILAERSSEYKDMHQELKDELARIAQEGLDLRKQYNRLDSLANEIMDKLSVSSHTAEDDKSALKNEVAKIRQESEALKKVYADIETLMRETENIKAVMERLQAEKKSQPEDQGDADIDALKKQMRQISQLLKRQGASKNNLLDAIENELINIKNEIITHDKTADSTRKDIEELRKLVS